MVSWERAVSLVVANRRNKGRFSRLLLSLGACSPGIKIPGTAGHRGDPVVGSWMRGRGAVLIHDLRDDPGGGSDSDPGHRSRDRVKMASFHEDFYLDGDLRPLGRRNGQLPDEDWDHRGGNLGAARGDALLAQSGENLLSEELGQADARSFSRPRTWPRPGAANLAGVGCWVSRSATTGWVARGPGARSRAG